MTPEQKQILEKEIDEGKRAEKAWTVYLSNYVDTRLQELCIEMIQCAPTPEELLNIKNRVDVLMALKDETIARIQLGKQSEKRLEETQ